MAGVDTQVMHGFVNCGATGAITGIGNVLPREVLQLVELSKQAAKGDAIARRRAHGVVRGTQRAVDLRRRHATWFSTTST